MTAVLDYLVTLPGRCTGCGGHLKTQGCACPGIAEGHAAMSRTLDARPDEAAQVEAVIRRLAASSRHFSANDARQLHGVRGGVVGATFNKLRAEGVIEPVGAEASTDRGTHGKTVALWKAVAA